MEDEIKLRSEAEKLYRFGDYFGAVAVFQRILEREPANPSINNFIGDAQVKLKTYDQATASYLAAVEGYRKDKLFNNAIAACKKILRFRPDDPGIKKIIDDLKTAQEI